jgi:hypothetical protein
LPDIPTVTFTRLYGFIDILNHMGGKADVAVISSKEQLELTDIYQYLKQAKCWILLSIDTEGSLMVIKIVQHKMSK